MLEERVRGKRDGDDREIRIRKSKGRKGDERKSVVNVRAPGMMVMKA